MENATIHADTSQNVPFTAEELEHFRVSIYPTLPTFREQDWSIGASDFAEMCGPDLTDLIHVRVANNMMMNAIVQVSEEKPDVIGQNMASLTFRMKGNCRFRLRHCNHHLDFPCFGCCKWELWSTISWDCLGIDGVCSGGEP